MRLLQLCQVVADSQDDGLKCRRAGSVEAEVSFCKKLQKIYANQLSKKCELIRIVGIEGRAIQRRRFRYVLDRHLIELFLVEETPQRIVQELARPADTWVQPCAVLLKHQSSVANQ